MLFAVTAMSQPAFAAQPTDDAPQRVIVKFRKDSDAVNRVASQGRPSTEAMNARINALATRSRMQLQAARALGSDLYVLHVTSSGTSVEEILSALRADSDVEFAEPDHRVRAYSTTSNDPLMPGQWYLHANQKSAVNATGAWDVTRGSPGVVVAVIDTGVLFDHPDLGRAATGGRLLSGYDFVSEDRSNDFSTANDGNGRDADPSDPGDACDGDPASWHGTRVSGIIGARADNGTGVAGILWEGYILPVRVLGRCGGFNSDVLAGIRWAAGLDVPGIPRNRYPAQVINVSLGSEGSCDSASASVIEEVTSAGALVVVAAGNEGGPVASPANCPGAMAIVGLRHSGTKVGFSSLGPQVALGAPGGNCVNTGTGQPCLFSIDTTSNKGRLWPGTHSYTDQTDYNVGTSFSAPIVSGIAGLMVAVNGNLMPGQLIQRMKDGASKPFPTESDSGTPKACHVPQGRRDIQATECACTTETCGAGMATALGAVQEALRPIAAVALPASFSAGQTISLQAGGSAAACQHDITTYSWTVLSGSASLAGASTDTVVLQAPTAGTVTLRLTVTDDAGRIDSADVIISPEGATTSAPAKAGANACRAAISLPATVSIEASDPTATEDGSNGAFTITRTGSTDAALSVSLTVGGTATPGVDYQTLLSVATIPAGASSITIPVIPIDDAIRDADETVIVTLEAGEDRDLGNATATVTIRDNEPTTAPGDNGDDDEGGGGSLDLLALLAALLIVANCKIRRRG